MSLNIALVPGHIFVGFKISVVPSRCLVQLREISSKDFNSELLIGKHLPLDGDMAFLRKRNGFKGFCLVGRGIAGHMDTFLMSMLACYWFLLSSITDTCYLSP